jgi:hypothetical protein
MPLRALPLDAQFISSCSLLLLMYQYDVVRDR